VISWCFSLLFFNLCQIWSIYFRASEYVFGPVKFSFSLNICISIYLMELIRALARMACKFQIPKSLTVLWFVIHILWFVAHIFWLFCGYTFTFSVKSMNYHHKRTSYFIFIQKNKQIIVCKTTLLLPKNNYFQF
jgi:hypothetical protein